MKVRFKPCAVSLLLLLALPLLTGFSAAQTPTRPDLPEQVAASFNPPAWMVIENRGQYPDRLRYCGRGPGLTCFFASDSIYLAGLPDCRTELSQSGPGRMVKLEPLDMGPDVTLRPQEPLPGRVNYLLTSDPKNWHRDLPTYQAVTYQNAYPGIDLKFYGAGNQLEYDIVIRPGGNPEKVRFRYQGVKSLRLTDSGDLAVVLPGGGELIHHRPLIYQEISGQRLAREGRFRVWREGSHWLSGFELNPYDKRYALVIDPVLSFSTYLGGDSYDEGTGIAVGADGYIYLTGRTFSPDFPTKDPMHLLWLVDAFVTKMKPDGSGLVYSTYLGGSDYDIGRAIAVDQAGCAYVTGSTKSLDFPLVNPVQNQYGGGSLDVFVAKLKADGSGLLYSTYLGGGGEDHGNGIAVDQNNQAYVTGDTFSTNFYTKNAMYPFIAGGYDAFITKFNADGSVVYSTYLGGTGYDIANGIAADTEGSAYIAGYTDSSFFPRVNAYQSSLKGKVNAFVTKINAGGTALIFSTYLGGNFIDRATGIAVDQSGQAHVTGYSASDDFPTVNAWQPNLAGGNNAFVTKFNAAGNGLIYSTYLGGSNVDWAYGIASTPDGQATITGCTWSTDFPRVNPVQAAYGGGDWDAFVARFSPDGSALRYSTYLGGSGDDQGFAVAMDRQGNAYVTGKTNSTNFPTRSPFQAARAGDYDVFVAKLGQIGMALGALDLLLLD